MSTISKERAELKAFITGFLSDPAHDDKTLNSLTAEVFRIALAWLEAEKNAEPVAKVETVGVCWYADNGVPRKPAVGTELFAAPPAPASVPDDVTAEDCPAFIKYDLTEVDEAWARGFNACRDALLQGAEPVTTANKLPDDFDFDRFNDVVWLEAVASNPHMHSLTTSTIAMVALELNKRMNVANSPVIGEGRIDEAI
ncbi:TPA: hypothetical protein I3946_002571 [Enterobacter cloacae]|nr:hypothetical protein [Enterobacter cloacae]HBC2543680.1 hypothetical protein [Enterobacter cloacae]